MKKIFIVVVDYKAGENLKKCLASLKSAIIPSGWLKEVLVINNNQINRGFVKAANIGIRKAMENSAEAILLLNPDTVVEKDFLIPLLNNPADIVGAVIRFKRNSKWIYDMGGRVDWRIGRTKHIEKFSILNYQFSNIDFVSGCAMLIKKKVIEEIGLLDEIYFLYFEDVDFCLRAKKAGFKIAVEPKSQIIHYLKEGRQKPLWLRWQLWKSNLLFVNQWIGWPQRFMAYGYLVVLLIKLLI